MDETLALPSEKAAEIALRTQQLIAFETGVSNVVDPLGGSYFIENLTDKIEEKAEEYFTEIDNLGGVINAIEDGYFQKKIAESASLYQESIDSKERIIVGVNDFVDKDEKLEIEILKISQQAQEIQEKKIKELREKRDNKLLDKKMKKYLTIALVSFVFSNNIIAQNIEDLESVKNLLKEDFSDNQTNFPILTTVDNYFIIDNGDYLLSRNNTESEYAILANIEQNISDFMPHLVTTPINTCLELEENYQFPFISKMINAEEPQTTAFYHIMKTKIEADEHLTKDVREKIGLNTYVEMYGTGA